MTEKAQVELQTAEVSLDTQTKKLHKELTIIKPSLNNDFNAVHTKTQAIRK
jgi:hypothetical protein